jgi:DNA-binding NtrC family response regulator
MSPPSPESEHSGSQRLQSLFLGSSELAQAVRKAIGKAARVDCSVLIQGESGVGKELVAREIHARSRRRDGPFVPVNCAAIPDTLIESELFGHEAGAFTDARKRRRGAFELAQDGTLFLDEVGDLSALAQPKLLRVIESREVYPIGSETSQKIDLRIIAATNHNLSAMRREGSFRSDLYFRLAILEILIPPLRERAEDVPELAEHFARAIAKSSGRPFTRIGSEAFEQLMTHSWPGNVRELRATVERALVMSSGMMLDASCFRFESSSVPGLNLRRLLGGDWKTARRNFERAYAANLLKQHGGNVYKAAQAANLTPRSLYKILRRVGLQPGPRSD